MVTLGRDTASAVADAAPQVGKSGTPDLPGDEAGPVHAPLGNPFADPPVPQLALAILGKPAAFWSRPGAAGAAEHLRLSEAARRGYPWGHLYIQAQQLLGQLERGTPGRRRAATLCAMLADALARDARAAGGGDG